MTTDAVIVLGAGVLLLGGYAVEAWRERRRMARVRRMRETLEGR